MQKQKDKKTYMQSIYVEAGTKDSFESRGEGCTLHAWEHVGKEGKKAAGSVCTVSCLQSVLSIFVCIIVCFLFQAKISSFTLA